LVALDTETSALDPMRAEIVGMSLAVAPSRSWYLPFAHVAPDGALAGGTTPRNLPPPASEAIAPLRELLSDARVPKAAHNIKYDWLVLRRAGIELAGVVYDSLLASFVLDPGRRSHAINDLARERLSLEMRTYADVAGRGRAERPFAAVPVADAARYSCGDSEVVLRLREAFQPELEDHRLLALLETVEVPLVSVLVEMEWRGVRVDLERLTDISRQFARELAELERAIYRTAGTEFNINSTPQLRHVLFEKHQLPILKKTKTGPSTDYDVLEQLAAMGHEVPRLLSSTASLRSSSRPTWTLCRGSSIPEPGESIPATTRPVPPPAACRPRIRISRTSPCGRRAARRSGEPSWRPRGGCSSPPTTPRSSCGCSPTCPATRRSCGPSSRAETSTARRRRSSSACPRTT